MRTRSLLTALLILVGTPLLAQDTHQSYITYDDSDSVLVQNDGKEVDARVNLPVYPGDQIRAARRGRTELRLADGNVLALDRESAVQFKSMLLNYEEGGEQTVLELQSGHVIVYRRYEGSEPLRLDTPNASFVAEAESIYGVETNSRGVDVATVFEGVVEVRTPQGSNVLRAGDRVKVDVTGVYDRRTISSASGTEFERWFLSRAERYANKESRHLDSSLAYAEEDLNENGRWVYVKDYDSWAWSPYVATGWRPYYNGYWGWGAGGSCWISYEPWGWVPYHYGNWSYVGAYGWMWFPGYVYAPAWVYWAWGPSWVGWVPWGYYSYYGGYYPWLYDPHCNPHVYGQYGFNGHVNVSSHDLDAYTVVDKDKLFSNRIDRAALTADAVRDRLARDGGKATLTNQPTRIGRDGMKDPSTAVDRIVRGSRDGSGTGSGGAGSSGDLTQFFRRDPALSQTIRDRVTRGQSASTTPGASTTTGTRGRNTMPSSAGTNTPGTTSYTGRGGTRTGGTIDRPTSGSGSTPSTTGSVSPRGGTGSTVPRGGGSTTGGSTTQSSPPPEAPSTSRPGVGGGVTPRTQPPDTPAEPAPSSGTDTPTVDRSGGGSNASSTGGSTRNRPTRSDSTQGGATTVGTVSPRTTTRSGDDPVSRPVTSGNSSGSISTRGSSTDTWRGVRDTVGRVTGSTGSGTISPRTTTRTSSGDPVTRPSTSGNNSGTTSTRGTTNDSWRGAGQTVQRVIGSIGGARLTPSRSGNSGSSGRSGSSGSYKPSTRGSSGGSSTPSTRSGSGGGGSGSVSRPSGGGSSPSSGSGRSSSPPSGGSSSSGSSSPRSGGGGTVHRGG